jgi:hypothetical protein
MRRLPIALLVCLVPILHAEPFPQLRPIDEATKDPQLAETRTALLAALRDRNVDFVMRYVSPNVVVERGGESGGQAWTRLFEDLSQRGSKSGDGENQRWGGMEAALSLGGSFTTSRGALLGRREFCAPYVYSAFPTPIPEAVRGEIPPWALIRANVDIREQPSSTARVLKRMSYALLQAPGAEHVETPTGKKWKSVHVSEDQEGFVPADAIRDPEGYHVCLARSSFC